MLKVWQRLLEQLLELFLAGGADYSRTVVLPTYQANVWIPDFTPFYEFNSTIWWDGPTDIGYDKQPPRCV
jgi:hypothetical protein